MAISLKEFRKKFKEKLLEIHWQQWSALGVASHIPSEQYWIIDIEALLASTIAIGLHDKRLLSAAIEWIVKNREWINSSRMKRIAKVFMKPLPGSEEYVLAPGVFKLMDDTIKKFKPFFKKYPNFNVSEEILLKEYGQAFSAFRIRDVVKQLGILKPPPLLQLLLRGYFGVDARAEIFLYLLFNRGNNSLAIAREVYYDQKNVYKILEKWTKTAFVTKTNRNYSLRKRTGWRSFWGLKKNIGYLNWVRTFLLMDQLLKATSYPPWFNEMYLLSSFFRDLFEEADTIGQFVNIQIPDPAPYKGGMYFEPFAVAILDILDRLRALLNKQISSRAFFIFESII